MKRLDIIYSTLFPHKNHTGMSTKCRQHGWRLIQVVWRSIFTQNCVLTNKRRDHASQHSSGNRRKIELLKIQHQQDIKAFKAKFQKQNKTKMSKAWKIDT